MSRITASASADEAFPSGAGFATGDAQCLGVARLGALGGATSASTIDIPHTDFVLTADSSSQFAFVGSARWHLFPTRELMDFAVPVMASVADGARNDL